MITGFKKCLVVSTLCAGCGTALADISADANLSEATQSGIGCLVAGSAALGTALWAGPSEVVMIAAGGLLVPSGTTPLLVGLTATVAVASCSVGMAATPAVLWAIEQVGL